MGKHTFNSCLENPTVKKPGRLQSMGSRRVKESDMTEQLHFHFSLSCIGEGNGNPLQSSCLENALDRGAWWATVHGIPKSQTRLRVHACNATLGSSNPRLRWFIRASPLLTGTGCQSWYLRSSILAEAMFSLSRFQLLPYEPLVILWRKDGQKPMPIFCEFCPFL